MAPSHAPTSHSTKSTTSIFALQASCSRQPARCLRACGSCSIKPQCTPNMTFRKIPRDVHEDARDQARTLMGTPEFDKSRDQRKRVEMRFAHLKTHHRFERMRLRGLSGARDEFHLAA